MFLHRVQLDPRCREARRDLADPYQMHSTLCRAFHVASERCPPGEFLWRLEARHTLNVGPHILVQAREVADWDRVGIAGWLARVDPALDLSERLKLPYLSAGQRFRFRLRANPCVTRDGKRQGLLRREDQERWLLRKGELHGFSVPLLDSTDTTASKPRIDVQISQEQMLTARKHNGNDIRIFSVLYDGILSVTDAEGFRMALKSGIGHGKALGLGLLSVAPIG